MFQYDHLLSFPIKIKGNFFDLTVDDDDDDDDKSSGDGQARAGASTSGAATPGLTDNTGSASKKRRFVSLSKAPPKRVMRKHPFGPVSGENCATTAGTGVQHPVGPPPLDCSHVRRLQHVQHQPPQAQASAAHEFDLSSLDWSTTAASVGRAFRSSLPPPPPEKPEKPTADGGLQTMLVELGLDDQVRDVLLREDITTVDSLIGLDKADLQGIGITLGVANRIIRAVVAKTSATAAGPAKAL